MKRHRQLIGSVVNLVRQNVNVMPAMQVATMYHDATIGNAVNIVLVRVIYLEQDEVRSV